MMMPEPDEENQEQVVPCQGVKGPFQSLHHTFAMILGLAGVTCFSIALVLQRPFDATLAAVVVMLCWYMVVLYTERTKLKARELDGLPTDSVALAAEQDGMCELDLTGYAKTLGVSISSGTGLEEGGTVSKMMLDALAKEYLRCMSALKFYQQAYGTLPEDSETSQIAKPPSAPLSLPLDSIAGSDCSTGPTPRSPNANPPSPDPKRSRAQIETRSAQTRTEGTSETQGSREASYQANGPSSLATSSEGSHQVNGTSSLATSNEEARPFTEDINAHSHLNSREDLEASPEPPCSFGLFGRY